VRRLAVILAVAGLAAPGAAAGEVYSVNGPGGERVYTNVPPAGEEAGLAAPPEPGSGRAGSAGAGRSGPSRRPFSQLVDRVAARYGVDPDLVHAVIAVESAYDPYAVSPKGAVGLMQLLPETAAELGIHHLTDAHDNVVGGVRYLRRLLDRYSGNLTLALAAYNAGAGAVDRHRGVPPYPETRAYVRKVTRLYAGSGSAGPNAAGSTIYRYQDASGAVVFSQFPPDDAARRRR
jgi:hypothetical protein